LIIPIGNWVLREACHQARAWLDAGLPVSTMAVNVSALEFNDDDFLDGVITALTESGLDPSLLELELTESVLMKRVDSTATTLHALRQRGIQVAVDDFGTGYSSLSYLQRFPVTAIKIARDFVAVDESDADGWELASAIVSMGRALRLTVIAEGVEEPFQLERLRKLRCGRAQGYYLARPLPADEMDKLFAAAHGPIILSRATVPDLREVSSLEGTPAA